MQIFNNTLFSLVVGFLGLISAANACLVMYGEYSVTNQVMELLNMWDGPMDDGRRYLMCYMEGQQFPINYNGILPFSCSASFGGYAARIITHGDRSQWEIQLDRAGVRLQFPLESSCSIEADGGCISYTVWVQNWC